MTPVFRFAPSPTGYLHVGGARTAIFNWLMAQKTGGKFLLRIEDTDKKRSTKEAIEQIFSSLKWLGIDWHGKALYQSSRQERHIEIARKLLDQGKAYRCFCSKEELAEKRRRAEALKINKRYDGTCRRLSAAEIRKNLKAEKPFSIRLKVEPGEVAFNDLVHGLTTVNNDVLDDFIILRPDGTPVYQLAVVADDHDMAVTSVLRGDDHLANTNKQILLYRALGWQIPRFGHLPLILGPDRVRLSKRHGATSVEEFKAQGIFPQALLNYLCLLGWSPGADKEILSRGELIEQFSLEKINNTPAVFDLKKLLWMNSRYLAEFPQDELWARARNWLSEQRLSFAAAEEKRLKYLMELLRPRSQTLQELFEGLRLFFHDPESLEEKGLKKYLLKESFYDPFSAFYETFKEQPETFFGDITQIESFIRGFAEKQSLPAARIIHPLRLALSGSSASPGIFELVYVLGKEKVLRRVQYALQYARQMVAL